MKGARTGPPDNTSFPALNDDRRCFACGPENADGLRLRFSYGPASAECEYVVQRKFGGWPKIAHGGIVVTLLDEAMAHAAIAAGTHAVTVRIEVRFRRAVPTGVPLRVEGRLERRRGRMLDLAATIHGRGGLLYAESRGRFIAERTSAAANAKTAADQARISSDGAD